MTKEQLLAIAARHEEDHANGGVLRNGSHTRMRTWGLDAVGDRGVLLEFIAELVQGALPRGKSWIGSALEGLDPPLRIPRLPRLHARQVKKP